MPFENKICVPALPIPIGSKKKKKKGFDVGQILV